MSFLERPPENSQSLVEGNWGEWPYNVFLPEIDLPSGVDPLIIADVEDLNRLDPFSKLPDPNKIKPTFLIGVPTLIGHLAYGASGLLICRFDEYGGLIKRINGFTQNPKNLIWVRAVLERLSDQTLQSLQNLKSSTSEEPLGEPGTGKGQVGKRLRQSLQPSDPLLRAIGLTTMYDRLQYYITAISVEEEAGGFSIGLVVERHQPMRPGKPLGYFDRHITLHSHIISKRAGNISVPRWN